MVGKPVYSHTARQLHFTSKTLLIYSFNMHPIFTTSHLSSNSNAFSNSLLRVEKLYTITHVYIL